MICKMEMVFKNGLMEVVLKVSLKMVWNMDREYINGGMEAIIVDTGNKI
jgi:hypothetical protein